MTQINLQQTKKCSKCGEEKSFSEFYKGKNTKDGLYSSCKQCKDDATSRMRKGWLSEGRCFNCGKNPVRKGIVLCEDCQNKRIKQTIKRSKVRRSGKKCITCAEPVSMGRVRCPSCLQRDRLTQLTLRNAYSKRVGDYFNNECYICGLESTDTEIYDCHHVKPDEKLYDIASLFNKDWESVVVIELEKCVYLCSICHRRFHHGRFDDEIAKGELKLIPGKINLDYRRVNNG